ncbi:hypothetical protein CMUST_02530 [Corynebacterium mustelae]|uniref:Uncharacterized protein n=1 Tax=Corynebacterium mustelae TaxID=571915 RepID=A0A0G3GWE5_9CORY|nr:hypothetical protein CMUST_02530 [Corynebacterium mustelae]
MCCCRKNSTVKFFRKLPEKVDKIDLATLPPVTNQIPVSETENIRRETLTSDKYSSSPPKVAAESST